MHCKSKKIHIFLLFTELNMKDIHNAY